MLDTAQNVFIVIISLVCSLFFMAGVNYYWPAEKRRAHNDLIGWQLSILGTTYAVIIGFMLYTVWISFGAADLNADAEANSLVNLQACRRRRVHTSGPWHGRTETRWWSTNGARWRWIPCPRKAVRLRARCGRR